MNRSKGPNPGIPPECASTLAKIQRALDGEPGADLLAPDVHSESCRSCRDRLSAARLLVCGLSGAGSVTVPSWLTGAILSGIDAEHRRASSRRRAFAVVGSLAAAAAVVIAMWALTTGAKEKEMVVQPPEPIPQPEPEGRVPAPAPPQPIQIDGELARAGGALRDSSRVLAEPLESAPRVLGGLSEAILKPASFTVSADLEPARRSLAEIPEAARVGLEPVTESAQKALDRLLKDVTALQPARPKS